MQTNEAILLLGANLGDRVAQMNRALRQIEALGCVITASSRLYETAPWGDPDQPAFLNRVLVVGTALEPLPLLASLQAIEREAGPPKASRWGARYLDIDILDFGGRILALPDLALPHPRLAERRFALVPLAEAAPHWRHPGTGLAAADMLVACTDTLPVKPFPERAA